jgi:hypothetical protein
MFPSFNDIQYINSREAPHHAGPDFLEIPILAFPRLRDTHIRLGSIRNLFPSNRIMEFGKNIVFVGFHADFMT